MTSFSLSRTHSQSAFSAVHAPQPALGFSGGQVRSGGVTNERPAFPAGVLSAAATPLSITRAHLAEIQTAEIGRKYGVVDRRPLDPPPVACVQLYLVTHPSTPNETIHEITDYETVDSSGFLCEAELFQVSASMPDFLENCTDQLVGSTFVQAATVEYNGRKILVFPFTDLSSKLVGDFVLRYKFFSIYVQGANGIPSRTVQAECWGHRFHVFSTKEVPSLQPSTELTKRIAEAGIPVSVRNKKREGKRKHSSEVEE